MVFLAFRYVGLKEYDTVFESWKNQDPLPYYYYLLNSDFGPYTKDIKSELSGIKPTRDYSCAIKLKFLIEKYDNLVNLDLKEAGVNYLSNRFQLEEFITKNPLSREYNLMKALSMSESKSLCLIDDPSTERLLPQLIIDDNTPLGTYYTGKSRLCEPYMRFISEDDGINEVVFLDDEKIDVIKNLIDSVENFDYGIVNIKAPMLVEEMKSYVDDFNKLYDIKKNLAQFRADFKLKYYY